MSYDTDAKRFRFLINSLCLHPHHGKEIYEDLKIFDETFVIAVRKDQQEYYKSKYSLSTHVQVQKNF